MLWFWLPSGHGWIGLLIVGGALLVAEQDAKAKGIKGPLGFLPQGG